MNEFDWENIDPNTPDERYVNSTIPVPEPSLVDDPLLPVSTLSDYSCYCSSQWKMGRNHNYSLTAITSY
jgi:hypothetical protein